MKTRVLKYTDLYVGILSALVGLILYLTVIAEIAEYVLLALQGNHSVLGILYAYTLAVAGLFTWLLRFIGPYHSSYAHLTWIPLASLPYRKQSLQIKVILLLGLFLFTAGLWAFYLKGSISVLCFVFITLMLIVLVIAGANYAVISQRLGVSHRAQVLANAFGLLSLFLIILSALSTPVGLVKMVYYLSVSGIVIWVLGDYIYCLPNLRNTDFIPRWELIRGETNIQYISMSIADMSLSHMRYLKEASNHSEISRIPLSALPKPLALTLILLLRSLMKQWRLISVFLTLSWSFSLLFGTKFSLLMVMSGSVLVSLQLSEIWIKWRTDLTLRRIFAATIPSATTGIAIAILTIPGGMVTLLSGILLVPFRQVMYLTILAVLGAIVTVLGREYAFQKYQRHGWIGEMMMVSADFLPIPTGIIRAIFSGWTIAIFLMWIAIYYPGTLSLLITISITISSVIRSLTQSTRVGSFL